MASTRNPPDDEQEVMPSGPSPAARRAQLERILADPALQASPRRRVLLRYLVEETLDGRADRLKGYSIALAVFNRDESFNPQSDPVVRLEARRLRRDLDGYYAGAGSHDRIRISIPRGGYTPQFEWMDGATEQQPFHLIETSNARAVAMPSEPLEEDAHAASSHKAGGRTWKAGWLHAVAAAAFLLICAAVGAWIWSSPRERGSDALARGPTVIVLPFEALSSGEDDRFLASGLTQQLVTYLMRFSAFRLYSLPASFQVESSADPRELGRTLDVSYVVKGNLRSANGSVRVGAQLIDADSGQVLWSESYDRPMTPSALLNVQDELASRIAVLLGQSYGIVNNDAASRLLDKAAAPSMPTYACILRAYAYRRTFGSELYPPVRTCIEDSVRRDPSYATGWAMLGWLHLDAARFDMVPQGAVKNEYDQAFSAADHAVELDPTNILALQALASINYYAGHYDESERLQRQALALNPNDPDTLAQFGWRLAARGKWQEGLPYLERAIDRTVNPPGWYFNLITVHQYLEGDYTAALQSAERGTADGSGMSWSFVAIAQGALGNRDAARQALTEMATRAPSMARDPAAAYRRHQAIESTVASLIEGLRKAGWSDPATQASVNGAKP
ncbi:tetratricopeptide repeat protein [Rhizobium sp. RAF56]|uniref:tetratricopeptide repeat protein n=1 Tax=Rhizobium sp. RAF56 TaxID=3233062 RepID=UPI003F9C17D1